MKLKQWLAAGTLCLTAWGAQAEVNQIRVWAAACANCHGTHCPGPLMRIKKMYVSTDE